MDLDQHPLVSSFRQAGELDPYFNMAVCGLSQTGWTDAVTLFESDDIALRELVMAYGYERWGTTNNHVAGSAFIIAYLIRVVYPAVAQFVLKRRVPMVTLENLAFHRFQGRIDATGLRQPRFAALTGDPDAGHPDAEVLDTETDLYLKLREWVCESNSEVVIKALRRSVPASIKVSRNAVAATCAQAFHRLYSRVDDLEAVTLDATTFFNDEDSPLYRQMSIEVVQHQGKAGLFGRRAGCCLVWRTRESDGYCSICILRPREEQTRQFQEMLGRTV